MAENSLIPTTNEMESPEKGNMDGFGSMEGNLSANASATTLGNAGGDNSSVNILKNHNAKTGNTENSVNANSSYGILENYSANNVSTNILKNYTAKNQSLGSETTLAGTETKGILNEEEEEEKEEEIVTENTNEILTDNPDENNPGDNPGSNPIPLGFDPPPDYGEDIVPDEPLTDDQKLFYQWDKCVAEFTATYKAFAGKQIEPFEKWIREQLKGGWHVGDPIPAYSQIITYPGKGVYYSKEVDAIYIVANSYSVARKYTYTNEYYGFWFYQNAKTAWKSELQQRDAVAKYYVMNPVSGEDMQNLLTYIHSHIGDEALKPYAGYTLTDLTKLQVSNEQAFRILIEKVQLKLFKTSTISGFGLYTPQTREKLVPKKTIVTTSESSYKLPQKPLTPFKRSGIVKGYEGVNLRPAPHTLEDPIIKNSTTLSAIVESQGFKNIPFNTHLHIQAKTTDGWYLVKTNTDGEEGYVAAHLVEENMPHPDAFYYRVQEGDTALEIVRHFYSSYSKENIGQVQWANQDFRNYVIKLTEFNKGGGITFPKDNVDKKEAWANVIVKKDMRIWIPSSATMYNMVINTPDEDLFGQHWVSTGIQDILDYSAGNQLIYKFMELWRKIPQEEKEKHLTTYYTQARLFLEKLRFDTPGWLDAILLVAAPPLYVAKSTFQFITEFEIGYIDYLLAIPKEKLVMSLEQYFFNTTQLDYYMGLMAGVIDGVAGWFKDLVQMFKDIGLFAWEMIKLQTYFITHGGEIGQKIADIIEYINTGEGQAKLQEVFASFNIFELMDTMEEGIKAFGHQAGYDSAAQIIAFANQSPYEMGKDIGYLIGYIIPEIVLAIFSAAIANAVKWVLKGLATVLRLLTKIFVKLVRIALKVLDELFVAIKSVGQGLKGIIAMLAKAGKEIKFLTKLDELLEGLAKFLKSKYDNAVDKGEDGIDLSDDVNKTDNTKTNTEGDNTTTDKNTQEGDNTTTKDDKVDEGDKKNDNLEDATNNNINSDKLAEIDRIKELRKTDINKRIKELGTDLDKDKISLTEGKIGAEIEEKYGYFERFKSTQTKKGDWISLSGKYKGKTFDEFGGELGEPALNEFIRKPSQKTKYFKSLDEHFIKADYVVLNLTEMKRLNPGLYDETLRYIEDTYGNSKLINMTK